MGARMIKLIAITASTFCAVGLMTSTCAARAEAADSAFVDAGSSDAASLQPAFAATIGDRVFFGFHGFTLSPQARATLSKQAVWLSRRSQLGVVIAGHCDLREARDGAVDLAARRTDAVFGYLSAQGIAFIRIRKVPYGVDRPLDTGTTEAALARNRSAQIILVGLSSR
jgi:peptidoglycan-associated lipoprotein